MTEFGASGDVRFDATFPGEAKNYRTYREPWVGEPSLRPALAVRGSVAYASWNGSTKTAWWRVDAGPSRSALRQVALVPRQGFETAIRLNGRPRLVSVTALDAAKRPLASSRLVPSS
jgi:hypothetical protein